MRRKSSILHVALIVALGADVAASAQGQTKDQKRDPDQIGKSGKPDSSTIPCLPNFSTAWLRIRPATPILNFGHSQDDCKPTGECLRPSRRIPLGQLRTFLV